MAHYRTKSPTIRSVVTPLEEMITPDNPVRVVDAFVDAIDLDKLGFEQGNTLWRHQTQLSGSFVLYFWNNLRRYRAGHTTAKLVRT